MANRYVRRYLRLTGDVPLRFGSVNVPRLPTVVWLGFAAAAAMVIGAFGPWGKVIGFVNVSVSGTDGANDGWLVVGAAAAGAACLFAYSRGARIAALGTLLAGVGGAYVAIHDRGKVTDAADENTSDLANIQVGWGLNLAIGASVVPGIIGLIALLGNQSAPGMQVAPAPEPTAAEPPAIAVTEQAAPSTADELERLADLHARGVLSEEEFQTAKQRLLNA